MSMVLVWGIVCVVAILVEIATPTALISIWFAVGGVIGALTALLHLPIAVQVVCFLVVSLVSMLVVRPAATHYLRGNVVPTNADRCIGGIGVVTKAIHNDEWGEVKVGGRIWRAVSVDNTVIEEQESVKIIAIEGAKLLVKHVVNAKKEGIL